MSERASEWRSWSAAPYLSVLLVAPLVYQLCLLFFLDRSLPGGVPVPTGVLLILTAVAVVVWTRYRPVDRWDWRVTAALMMLVVMWAYAQGRLLADGAAFIPAVLLAPLLPLLIWAKRPSSQDVRKAADVLSWAFVAACVVVLALESMGVVESWYSLPGVDLAGLIPFDRENYWLPMMEVLGLDGRWGGPFRHPNLSGFAAAFLLVYGFTRPRARATIFVVTGLLVLMLASSRGAYAAAAAGVLLLAVLPGWGPAWSSFTARRMATPALGVAIAARLALWVREIPELSGRTDMWPEFLAQGDSSPWFGVGDSGISGAVADGRVPAWAFHGHNLWVDSIVRLGWVGVSLTAVLMVLVALVCLAGIRRGAAVGTALFGAIIVMTLVEVLFVWWNPNPFLPLLVVTVLLASCDRQVYGLAAESSRVATSTTSTPSARPSP